MNVTKRDGKTEPLDFDKMHKVVMWACNDITGVSMSEVEMAAQIQFHEGIKTEDIHRTLVKAAADLVTEKSPNYQFVAGRLVAYDIQKRVNGGPTHPRLFKHVTDVVEDGFYDPDLLVNYTEEQWDELESIIDYGRETEFTYAAMETFRGKYLLRDRTTGVIKETPLQSYITICATAMMNEPVETRFGYIKDMYKLLCDGTISLPTPIMAGLRSTEKQFSSCVLVETGDDLDTITTASAAIVKYVSKKAGIGINGGQIRAVGSSIRNGAVTHTGLFSFYRYMDASVRAVSQGGVRSAAATLNYPWWHYEFMDMIELKNRTGTEDNRLRQMDYCVQFNKLFYARFLAGENVSLFSPSEVEGLYESFFNNQDKFKELYEIAEKDESIRRITIPAKTIMSKFIEQRKETGRIYFSNVDHVNSHGSYDEDVAPVRMTNLCVEIGVPTNPMKTLTDPEGEIGVCTLFAINYGNIHKPEDFEKPARIAIRALNNILDYQEYPVEAAKRNALGRRPLGGGIVNFAYYLAKNDMTYSNPDLEAISDMVEAHSYWLHKASADMAVERGACELFHETKYAKGILPIDTYKGAVDQLVAHNPKQDWEGLRKQILETGILNSSLMAIMPAECQSLDNEMLLEDGTVDSLENLLKGSGIDVDSVHESGAVGQRFDLLKPLYIKGREVNQCYYNGIRETTYIVFSDGSSYRFTDNHKLLVDVDGEPLWGRVDSLREGDKMFSDMGGASLFVTSLTPNFATEHTWDISTNDEQYILSNGVTSHNTSAAVSNSTNGIEPVRGLITYKQTKDTVMPQVVPSIQRYKNKYEKLWDMPSPKGYLDIMSIIQKWGDQAISVNFTYTPSNYENDTIPESVMVGDLLNFYKYGGKNGYYSNTLGIQESDIIGELGCSSCVL